MMLDVQSVKTDKIDHVTAANEFVGQREKRQQLFGKFTGNRIPLKLSFLSQVNSNVRIRQRNVIVRGFYVIG